MQVLRVTVEGSFNSFRYPREMNYQRSFRIPPKTTIIGHLGSALGLSEDDLIPLYTSVNVGIFMDNLEGMGLDLWRITKLKSSKNETAVIIRELLFRPRYIFYYSPQPSSGITLEKMQSAFLNPVYAPCLGRSDELALYKEIKIVTIEEASSDTYYRYTVLPFSYLIDAGSELNLFQGSYFLKNIPPEVIPQPISFFIKKGARESVLQESTMVYGIGVRLTQKRGWKDENRAFFLF